jgi:3-phenylpropionate/trans-cinnamate dioxygenase ferredoxin reductase component
MKKYKYIIIGGGTTAGYAAKEFVEQGFPKGELCIVSAESILPMNRPPLSKDYLRDKDEDDEVLINEKDFYELNGIDVMLETCAREVKFGDRQVELDNGEILEYEKLLIATGSKLKRLGIPGGSLENIFYLRNIMHANKIRKTAKNVERAIVVGGGYIGTETAAILNQLGLKVTMIVPENRLLAKFATADIAAFFQNTFRNKGIEIIFHDEVTAFHGDEKVEEVELKSKKRLVTNMVVAGIGVEPATHIFEKSRLNINEGIVVNEYCETNLPDVYAAGDVAEFPDLLFDKSRVVEHWEHAFEQGKHAARVMAGKREPYLFLPFFFSDVFGYSYEYFGDNHSADTAINRGDLKNGNFSTWWVDGNRLVAAFVMASRPEEEGRLAREWITNRRNINRDKIADTSVKMKELELNTELYRND